MSRLRGRDGEGRVPVPEGEDTESRRDPIRITNPGLMYPRSSFCRRQFPFPPPSDRSFLLVLSPSRFQMTRPGNDTLVLSLSLPSPPLLLCLRSTSRCLDPTPVLSVSPLGRGCRGTLPWVDVGCHYVKWGLGYGCVYPHVFELYL